jgi:hypothetical protein
MINAKMPGVEKEEEGGAKVLNPDNLVIGGEVEITARAMKLGLLDTVQPPLKGGPSPADGEVHHESDHIGDGGRSFLGQFCLQSEIQRQKRRDAGGDAAHESKVHQLSPSANCCV